MRRSSSAASGWKLLAAAAMLSLAASAAARAEDDDDDKNKVECSDTDLDFTLSGFTVECYDVSESAVGYDGGIAGLRAKKLFAIDVSGGVTFILALDVSVVTTGAYLEKSTLRE